VRLNLTHVFDSDVDITLASAQNTIIDVSTDNGAALDNYVNTVLVDSAATSIVAGVAPFTGSFRPEQSFSTLTGQVVTGTWRGLVADDTAFFSGSIQEYALAICIQ
jgi:subtilisin-like proprotein convertase family protein